MLFDDGNGDDTGNTSDAEIGPADFPGGVLFAFAARFLFFFDSFGSMKSPSTKPGVLCDAIGVEDGFTPTKSGSTIFRNAGATTGSSPASKRDPPFSIADTFPHAGGSAPRLDGLF
jgi:hypothetical protein